MGGDFFVVEDGVGWERVVDGGYWGDVLWIPAFAGMTIDFAHWVLKT